MCGRCLDVHQVPSATSVRHVVPGTNLLYGEGLDRPPVDLVHPTPKLCRESVVHGPHPQHLVPGTRCKVQATC